MELNCFILPAISHQHDSAASSFVLCLSISILFAVYLLLQLGESKRLPVLQDLLLNALRVGILEVASLPVLARRVFHRQQRITYNLASLDGIAVSIAHKGNESEAENLLEEDLVQVGTAAGGEGPQHVLVVVNVNVVAHEDEAVHGEAGLDVEDEVADLLCELLAGGLEGAELGGVDLEDGPGGVGEPGAGGLGDGEAGVLADLADPGGGEDSEHGVLLREVCVSLTDLIQVDGEEERRRGGEETSKMSSTYSLVSHAAT